MKTAAALAACLVAVPAFALADATMQAFASKMKPGLYDYKIEMDMGAVPGMPAGMGKHTMNVQHCLTAKDIADGQLQRKDPNNKVDCQIQNMKMSGSSASYRMVCKGEMAMTSDVNVSFVPTGYVMNMKMTMNHGGQTMTSTHNTEARYLGACK